MKKVFSHSFSLFVCLASLFLFVEKGADAKAVAAKPRAKPASSPKVSPCVTHQGNITRFVRGGQEFRCDLDGGEHLNGPAPAGEADTNFSKIKVSPCVTHKGNITRFVRGGEEFRCDLDGGEHSNGRAPKGEADTDFSKIEVSPCRDPNTRAFERDGVSYRCDLDGGEHADGPVEPASAATRATAVRGLGQGSCDGDACPESNANRSDARAGEAEHLEPAKRH